LTGKRIIFVGLIFTLTVAGGCDSGRKKEAAVDSGPAAAAVGGESISVEALNAYIEQRLSGVSGTIDEAFVQRCLQELVTTRSLAREARRQELDRQPAVRREIDQLLAGRLLHEKVIGPVSRRQITDEEIASYYKEHIHAYSRPEQIRLGDIFIAAAENEDLELRKAKREEAEAILREASAVAGERNGFSALVREHSSKHPLYRLGDTGFFDRQGDPQGLDPSFVDAAFSISDKGAVFDRVIETKDGFHIVMLVSRRSAVEQELEAVAAEIRQKIRREETNRKKQEFIASITARTKVKIHEEELQALAAELHKKGQAGNAQPTQLTAHANKKGISPPMIREGGKE